MRPLGVRTLAVVVGPSETRVRAWRVAGGQGLGLWPESSLVACVQCVPVEGPRGPDFLDASSSAR